MHCFRTAGVEQIVAANPLARSMLVAVLVLTVGAGCVEVSSGPTERRPAPAGGGLGRSGGPPTADEANAVVQRALKDVERYWAATYPRLADGAAFKPVQGGYHPYTRSNPPPGCGSEAGEYQPNAFYCPVGDFIAWDAELLIPQLHADFGPLLVGVVIAHEYGHAVQARLRQAKEPTVVLEQQADCFAGSWTGDIAAGHSDAFGDVSPDQLDSTLAGMLMLRDKPGTPALAPEAHGNAFDRIRAFQEGVEQSASRCATYRSDNIPVTEVPFTSREDAATGGDLPYAKAVTALYDDAQGYWKRTFPKLAGKAWDPVRLVPFDPADPPECPGRQTSVGATAMAAYYCPTGSYLAFDNQQLGPALYQRIGDNAVGMLLGDLFAQAVQDRRGRPTGDRPGQLAVDCLAGTWTNDLLNSTDTDRIRLSPGDLDEAVAALLVFGRASAGTGPTAFERITAFRNGTLKGLPPCG
jgi:predicted metalloprotease